MWYVISSWIYKFHIGTERKNSSAPENQRFIIVEFQTDKYGDQIKNLSTFDHMNLKNAYVTQNPDRYPAVDYNLSFSNQKLSRVYGDVALFGVNSLLWMNFDNPIHHNT